MKKQMKPFILGFLAAVILMSTTIIFADDITQMIEVTFNTIHLKVDGKDVEAENILYNDKTYVPLRVVAEMLGKDVNWDEATNTADIGDKVVAVQDENTEIVNVNNESITLKDLGYYLKSGKMQMDSYAQQSNAQDFWNTDINGQKPVDLLKNNAVDQAVSNKIQLQKAKELNLSLSDDDLKQADDQRTSYITNFGGQDQYIQKLNDFGLTDESFIQMIKDGILLNKLYDNITGADKVSEITDQELKDYYDKNKEQYKEAKAKHILFSTVDDQGNPLPQEKQDEAKKKADEVLAKIKAGEDFDKLMNENSQDPGLKTNPEGYTVEKGKMVKEFEDAAFALKKDQVSEVVKSSYGYHIIKVIEEVHDIPFDDVKDQIKQELESQRNSEQQQKYSEQIDQWKKDAAIKINDEELKNIQVK